MVSLKFLPLFIIYVLIVVCCESKKTLEEHCVEVENSIWGEADETKDPCEDFYEYVCGKSKSASNIALTEYLSKKLSLESIKDITDESPDYQRKLKAFFEACLYLEQPPNARYYMPGLTPETDKFKFDELKFLLDQVGGWPVVKGNEWDETNFRWEELLPKLGKIGFKTDYIINLFIGIHPNNNMSKIVDLHSPTLGFSPLHLLQGLNYQTVREYKACMVGIAVMFGADRVAAEEQLDRVLKFEIALANALVVDEIIGRNITTVNIKTVEQLQNEYGIIDWLKFINLMVSPLEELTMHDEVNIYSTRYMNNLMAVFYKKWSPRTIANYIIWRAVENALEYLPKSLRFAEPKCETVFERVPDQYREYVCLKAVQSHMFLAMNSLFAQKYSKPYLVEPIREMTKNIHNTVKQMTARTTWMDEETRKKAVKKLSKIHVMYSFPKPYLQDELLNSFYENLFVSKNRYLSTSLNANLFTFQKELSFFKCPSNWLETYKISTFHFPFYIYSNLVYISIDAAFHTIFDGAHPYYKNYATYGAMVADPFARTFSPSFRRYNENAELKEWMSPKSLDTYFKKFKCLENYFKDLRIHNIPLKAQIIASDTMNDIMALKAAYYAYVTNNATKNSPGETRCSMLRRRSSVESYEPTREQLFWVSYASMFCEQKKSDMDIEKQIIDGVIPRNYRMIEVLKQMKEFAKDFQCKPGSKMNPTPKCEILGNL